MRKIFYLTLTFFLVQNIYAKNPKAERMAELITKQINQSKAKFGIKNPNMEIKTYNIKEYIYQDRREYYYSADEILPNVFLYRKQLEYEYCPISKMIMDKYDVVYVFNVFGKYGKKVFTHTLKCK